jgi:NAD-dependent deacetylase
MPSTQSLETLRAQATRIVAFTGAGISAESGIPTYRGDEGVWNRYDPDKYANIDYFNHDPAYYWRFFQEVRAPVLHRAKPNPGHQALARMERRGALRAVITQNIDGLHQMAGSERVLELHGNTRRIACLKCRRIYDLDAVTRLLASGIPPVCSACRGVLKPEVVFFGEALPQAVLAEAMQEAMTCDLFLAVGSSLVVQPAASLPVHAKQNRAKLVIINKQATPLDSMADLVIRDSASTVLGELSG